MDKESIGYSAGFFDADGHIEVIQHKPTYRCPYGQYSLTVRVTQKSRQILDDFFMPNFDGKIILQKQCGYGSYIHHWQLHGGKAKEFLKLILPYLRLKKAEAEVAIQFQETFATNWPRGRGHNIDPALLKQREQLLNQFRKVTVQGESGLRPSKPIVPPHGKKIFISWRGG